MKSFLNWTTLVSHRAAHTRQLRLFKSHIRHADPCSIPPTPPQPRTHIARTLPPSFPPAACSLNFCQLPALPEELAALTDLVELR